MASMVVWQKYADSKPIKEGVQQPLVFTSEYLEDQFDYPEDPDWWAELPALPSDT